MRLKGVNKMAEKTAKGLVEYCIAQLGRPYWYGTYGQIADRELYEAKKKQYYKYYCWANDYEEQFGQKVHDCTGLTEGYLMSATPNSAPKYKSDYDFSANGLYRACEEKGTIDTIPEIPGVCVFYDGHTGVYIGNGNVIEARGHAYGVIMTKLADRPWENWGKHPYIDYGDEPAEEEPKIKTVDIDMPVLKKGMKNIEAVKTLQRLLKQLGYKGKDNKVLTIDGSFGGNTDFAVRWFQDDENLDVDGSVGRDTWTALLIK